MDIAIIRPVSRSIEDCELTHMDREPISHEVADAQHRQYVRSLQDLGLEVIELEPLHHHPDAVFVEDIAVVTDEVAILTRPGAHSRRDEVESIVQVLADHRDLARLESPGTLDGGDVIQVDRTVYIGESSRTNADAIEQMRRILEPLGYEVRAIPIPGALHLKTAASYLGDGVILANPAWFDVSHFDDSLKVIAVDPDEPFAGNGVRIGNAVLFPERFDKTAARLEAHGFTLIRVPASELAKAEGSLTCKSILLRRAD